MSLINDALKRAKQAQHPARPAEPTLQFRPVDPPPAQTARHSVGLLMPVGLTGIALLGLVLVWELRERGAHQEPAAAKQIVATETIRARPIAATTEAEPTSASTAATAAPLPSSATVTAPVQPKANIPGDAVQAAPPTVPTPATSSPSSSNVTSIAEIEAPKPPKLKLHSIIFGSSRPSAMINGRPLFIGDHIGDFRVIAISPDSATLVGAGQTNILSLSE